MKSKAQYSVLIIALVAVSNLSAADLPSELRACAAQSNKADRLACFDKIAATVKLASEEASVATAPKVERQQGAKPPITVTEENFGLRPEASSSADTASRLNRISSKVAKVEEVGRGRLIVTLENGQVWEQLTADRLFVVNPGEVVTIKTGTFNSFLLVTAFNRFTTVNRVR